MPKPLDEAVEVMARLRAPGGCPWDAEQTHASLARFAIEESHELVEAIEAGDDAELADELGDVLLQVLFHAEVAKGRGAFTIDDVAAALVAKLRRRHPHVFAGVEVSGADEVVSNWQAIKAVEKPERQHPGDGIPASLPALQRAEKLLSRFDSAGLDAGVDEVAGVADERELGELLLAVVAAARAAGQDSERALRQAIRRRQEHD